MGMRRQPLAPSPKISSIHFCVSRPALPEGKREFPKWQLKPSYETYTHMHPRTRRMCLSQKSPYCIHHQSGIPPVCNLLQESCSIMSQSRNQPGKLLGPKHPWTYLARCVWMEWVGGCNPKEIVPNVSLPRISRDRKISLQDKGVVHSVCTTV